jgi:transposase InsO family protein
MAAVEYDGHGVLPRGARKALAGIGTPDIFNTDQGAQFTSAVFTGRVAAAGIAISMDGRGRWMDSSGFGARSNTRRCISKAMRTAARRAPASANG